MKYLFCLLLLFTVSGCSHKTEEQLVAEGKNAEDKKDFALAVNIYTDLVSDYSASKNAELAQYKIAVIYNNEIHDVQKAIAAYRKFYFLFPKSENAPSALFLTGFLFNNEIHNVDSARLIYNIFLKLYPNHDLANSAKFELSTLGKDPDAVLHNDILSRHPADSSTEKLGAK